MRGKDVLLFLGGSWHDFDGFRSALEPILAKAGHAVSSTYDLGELARLNDLRPGVLMLYTSFGSGEEGKPLPAAPDAIQVAALTQWVRGGGGLVAVHAATASSRADPALSRLVGGVFESHPPQFAFTVYPLYRDHPITAGIDAFAVYDEFYVQTYDAAVQIHMVATDRGVAHPMVWSKAEGAGKVVYIAMGHGPQVWDLPAYRRLLLQAVDWAAG
jgi:uncharacterized protein